MKLRRILVLSAVGSLMVLYGQVSALAASESAKVGTQTEAWYVTTTSETCSSIDCSMLAAPAEFPKNTLHVGISNGTPTAATYIEFDMFSANIPTGSVFTKGTVTLPVDMAPGDGTLRQDAAELQVCQVTEFFSSVAASPDKPPATDCETSANAKYSAEPAPTFTVDLGPFLAGWSKGDSAALAILPAPEAEEASETWHVAFYGKDYGAGLQDDAPVSPESGTPKPITAKLTYEPEPDGETTTLPPPEPEFTPPPAPSPPPISPIDVAPPEPADIAPVADAELPPEEAVEPAPEPVAAPEFITVGYQYPIAWIMPLLLLIGFAMTGHSLTRSLERPGSSLG
ncbi:hypothetical protein [Haloechinothrix salitolerans]|uniref:Uncharacterized protein n=1 Tax=Haloechinothrix salitolerans TaxID=926830 RepID=A0ABW2BTD3_9PSEU